MKCTTTKQQKILLEQAGHAQIEDNPNASWVGDDPVNAYYIQMGIELFKQDQKGK